MTHRTETPGRVMVAWIACNLLGWLVVAALSLRMHGSPFNSLGMLVMVAVPPALAQWLILRWVCGLTPLWLVTIPIGFLVFVGVVSAIPVGVWQFVDDEGIATISTLYAVLGALIGVGQWLILRRQFPATGIWIAASAAGTGIGFALVLATGLINHSELASYTVVMLTYATLTGTGLRWLLARARPMDQVHTA